MVKSLKQRVLDILINRKLITSSQLDQALKVQKEQGGSLSKILVGLKFLDLDEVSAKFIDSWVEQSKEEE